MAFNPLTHLLPDSIEYPTKTQNRSHHSTLLNRHRLYLLRMFMQNLLLSCWACISGHRATSCQHHTRPLYALKNKGRPRPGTGRTKDCPDIMSLNDASFQCFREEVMNDPVSRKEYFHEAPIEPATKSALSKSPGASKAKRSAPYIVKNRKTGDVGGLQDIYGGVCTEEGKLRWRKLTGIDAA